MSKSSVSAPFRPLSRLLMAAAAVTGMLAFIQVYSVQAILPLFERDFQASPVVLGYTVGATVLGVAITSPFMGMLSDAWGRKWLIVSSVFFLAVPTALLSLAGTVEQVIVLRFLQGVAVPGITVVLIAYIGEEFQAGSMTRLMSLYVSGTVLGGFLGRFLMGHLSEWMHWRTAFLCMAVLNVIGAVLVWQALPASSHFEPSRRLRQALATLASHLCNRHVLTACALGGCVLFSLVACFTYVNLHLAAPPYGFNSGQLANIFAVYLIGMLITPLTVRLLLLFGVKLTALLAITLSMSGVLLTLLAPAWAIIVALTLMSSGVFIIQSSTISFLANRVTRGRSLASGLYYMSYYAGGTIGAIVGGIAYTRAGWPGTVGVVLAVQVMGAAIVLLGMPRRGA